MNYEESVDYIEGLAVFGSCPGFERIDALLDKLDHPEKGLKYIHVAGTNGKGSVCTTTSNILTAAGYKTGLFISPFVSDFRERIQIDGQFIPKETMATLTTRVKSIVDELIIAGIQPTEFEVITAIAFLFYKEENCDIVVLEVGLGGLLDSTNVIDTPLVSVIVSLSLDHMGVLGNTIEEIAAQKAGIIKNDGVTVCARQKNSAAYSVIKNTALKHNNEFIGANPASIKQLHEDINGNTVEYQGLKMTLPLIGPHQIDNLSVSLAIIESLRNKGYDVSDNALIKGVEITRVPARVEVLSKSPLVILDGGHNDDGAFALAETLKSYVSDKEITLVIGVMADKEVDKVIGHLVPLAKHVITTTPKNPRALEAPELLKKVLPLCKDAQYITDPCQAFDTALASIDKNSTLVACGSLYLAGDIRLHMMDSLS